MFAVDDCSTCITCPLTGNVPEASGSESLTVVASPRLNGALNAIPAGLIRDRQPDVVVTLDAYAQRTLLVDPTFAREYRLERRIAAPVWLSQELLVFRRAEDAGN